MWVGHDPDQVLEDLEQLEGLEAMPTSSDHAVGPKVLEVLEFLSCRSKDLIAFGPKVLPCCSKDLTGTQGSHTRSSIT